MARQIPWARVLAEGVVIVVSILLAFAIDAWWDKTQERAEEQRILVALAADFEDTKANLLKTIESTEQVRDTIKQVLDLISVETPVADEEIRALVRGSFWWHHPEPQLSTYTDITSSGNLGLVRSDSLRLAMALTAADLEQLTGLVGQVMTRWVTVEEPFLSRHFDVGDLFRDYRGADLPELPFRHDSDVLRSRAFANILAGRVTYFQDIIGSAEDVLVDIQLVLDLIERSSTRR